MLDCLSPVPHLPYLRSAMGEGYLSAAAANSDAGHQCDLPSCDFRGQQLLEVRKMGRQEVHQECDLMEELHGECDLREEVHEECDLREEVHEECDLREEVHEECDLRKVLHE